MKRDKGIRLSKKYGVNPTIPVCFWCGKEKNEIALMGHIGDGRKGEDIEAPICAILDYVPCEECEKNMHLGVTVMEASNVPIAEGFPEMQEGVYPTGNWYVIRQEAAERVFGDKLNGSNKVFVDQEAFSMLFGKEGP